MTNPNTLKPDFDAREELVNQGTFQILLLMHETPDTVAFLDGYKDKGELGSYYSFGWQTHMSVEEAAKLMDNAGSLPGVTAERGEFIVCEPNETFAYDWGGNIADGSQDAAEQISGLDLTKAALIRLNIKGVGDIAWEKADAWGPELSNDHTRMAVITSSSIYSRWLWEIFEATVTPETKEVVARNIGPLVAAITTFTELPFGECSLEGGFSETS